MYKKQTTIKSIFDEVKMSVNFSEAKEEYGIVEFSRWMLEDGQFLGVFDYDDHRIVGEFCTISWLEFIGKGCVSVHYDGEANYLWIRVNSDLNFKQRQSFKELFESEYIKVSELYLAELYLTDRIAYQLEKQYESAEYE